MSVYATDLATTAKGFADELTRVRGLPAGTDTETQYKTFLQKGGLPPAAHVTDLYTAP